MIYLHGAGLMDRSIAGLKNDYIPYHLEHDKVLPFIVVSPVCKTNGWDVTILNFLLEDVVHKFNVDENKIYLTGHSMGGFGTWDWAMTRILRNLLRLYRSQGAAIQGITLAPGN